MLAAAPDVDVVIAGHNHGGQENVKDRDGRPCVKVRAYGRELGRLQLNVDTANDRVVSYEWERIPITTSAYEPDATVARLVDEWESKVAEIVDVPIGRSARQLGGRELQTLIEMVMRQATGADLAYMNRGGIRDRLPKGEIQARDVWNILPFGNSIYLGKVKGSEMPKELREGGSVNPRKEYVVATNSFIGDRWVEDGLVFEDQGVPGSRRGDGLDQAREGCGEVVPTGIWRRAAVCGRRSSTRGRLYNALRALGVAQR